MPYLYVYQQPVSESKAIGENTSFTLLAKSEESYDWHWESKTDAQSSWGTTDAGTELPSGSFFHMSDVAVYGNEDDPLPTIEPDEISLSIPVTAERNGHIYRCVLTGTDTVTSNEVTLTVGDGIAIDAINFPDAAWRQYVSDNYDTNNDGYLSDAEIANVTQIVVSDTSVESINIEVFSYVSNIYIDTSDKPDLVNIKISNCPLLMEVNLNGADPADYISSSDAVYHSALESLQINNCPELLSVESACNSLNSVILANVAKIEYLDLRCNLLTSLDLRSCVSLKRVYCFNNGNLQSINLEGLTNLEQLIAQRNNLSTLNLPNSSKLDIVECNENNINSLDISNNPLLLAMFRDRYGLESGYAYDINEPNKSIRYGTSAGPEIQVDQNVRIMYSSSETAPVITTQPQSASIVEGNTATFTVVVSGNGLSYQWEVSIDYGETWAGIRNATASSYSIQGSLSESGNKYRCTVSNTAGSITSNAATLTVTEDTRLQPPVITANPSSTTVADGDTAAFTVTATGDGLSYQWQTNQNGSWYSISGATSRTYSIITVTTRNGSKYRCQVSNAAGTVYSSEATLTVTGGSSVSTPVITSQPISATVVEGAMAKFNIYASGGSLSYQWQVKRNGTWYNVSGATDQSLSVRGTTDVNGNEYRCMVSNLSGVAYSTVAVLTVQESGPVSFYGYHSIIISGKNTYGEWQMYPTSRPHVAPPEVKTAYVDIPGADGGFDYTELLNKTPNYGFRKGSWEFLLIPQERWADVYRSLVNFLHGRQHTIILEDDPNFMYTGRLSVNEWRSAAHNSLITIDYILDPDPIDTSDEHYNPDEEDLKAAGRILRKPEHSDSVIMLVDGVETIVPISSMYDDGDNILY